MLKYIKRFYKKSSAFLCGVLLSGTAFIFIQAKEPNSYFEISKNLEIFANVFKELNELYVDPIQPGAMVKTGVDAMLENLDPYTTLITEAEIEDYEFQTTGKYGGIGANMRKKGDDIFVGDVYENSPAQKAGLHPGDLVISVNQNLVKGKTIDELSVLLKGSAGTQAVIKVKDAYTGKEEDKMVTRGEIEVSSVPYFALTGKDNNQAYVKLIQFTPGCSRLVRAALDSLKTANPNLKGVVLDLRNNPGGLLDEAVAICNLFVDRNILIVSTKGKHKEMDKEYKTLGAAWDEKIPLTVLVNHSSASASEIVAGTMQDLDRGVIIGEKSYGKGLVQVTRSLGYNARLKLTIAKYYTPSGRCIQAIDYAHRNADGSAGKVPDSLIKTYYTKAGRPVLSGGGVLPDVKMIDDKPSKIAITLYAKNYIFDYATQYAKQHSSINAMASFTLADADFNDFIKYLDGKDYAYKTETEMLLDSLKQTAIKEKYFDAAKADIASLQSKVSHDKQQDLLKNKTEIIHLLENEIISRYYFQKGRIAQTLRYDEDLKKANSLLADNAQYMALLKGKK